MWLSAETHCLTDALEHIEGVWRPKRVFDSDGRASQDFSRACHPKWQLEHLEDDFDVEDWIDVPGDD